MSNKLPDPVQFCSCFAELHQKSVLPTGKFGFHITTYRGRYPQVVDWDSSWEPFYGKFLRGIIEIDRKINGLWNELDEMIE